MQRIAMGILVVAAVLVAGLWRTGAEGKEEGAKMLRHVVLMKFKAESKPEQIQAVEEAFAALPGKIKEIAGFEWGTDVSVENLSQGFTHCFFVTFKSEKDRETYLPHPDHLKFVDLVKPQLEKVLVVDYWAK